MEDKNTQKKYRLEALERVILAAYDIVRGYEDTLEYNEKELSIEEVLDKAIKGVCYSNIRKWKVLIENAEKEILKEIDKPEEERDIFIIKTNRDGIDMYTSIIDEHIKLFSDIKKIKFETVSEQEHAVCMNEIFAEIDINKCPFD